MQRSLNQRLIWTVHICWAGLMTPCSSFTLHLIRVSFFINVCQGGRAPVSPRHCRWHAVIIYFHFSFSKCCYSLNILLLWHVPTLTEWRLVNNTFNLFSTCPVSVTLNFLFLNLTLFHLLPQKDWQDKKHLHAYQYSWRAFHYPLMANSGS